MGVDSATVASSITIALSYLILKQHTLRSPSDVEEIITRRFNNTSLGYGDVGVELLRVVVTEKCGYPYLFRKFMPRGDINGKTTIQLNVLGRNKSTPPTMPESFHGDFSKVDEDSKITDITIRPGEETRSNRPVVTVELATVDINEIDDQIAIIVSILSTAADHDFEKVIAGEFLNENLDDIQDNGAIAGLTVSLG